MGGWVSIGEIMDNSFVDGLVFLSNSLVLREITVQHTTRHDKSSVAVSFVFQSFEILQCSSIENIFSAAVIE